MNMLDIAAATGVPKWVVGHHLNGLGLHKVDFATELEPLFAECVITSLKPLDITKPTTPRIIRWFLGTK